jgi:NAD-dependent deacetylase
MNDDVELPRVAIWLQSARKVAVLTGAGISAESGLPTFRGAGGLWEGHRVEDVATPEAFRRDPLLVWRFYNKRRADLARFGPNPGHHALVDLEKRFGQERFTLITQNVDGFHTRAGNEDVIELHGALRRVRCSSCKRVDDRGTEPLPELPHCEACAVLLRPDVVWFGEELANGVWDRAQDAAADCDVLLVVGTSAQVYPAAGLLAVAQVGGARVVEINPEATAASEFADAALRGPSGEILPALVRQLSAAS